MDTYDDCCGYSLTSYAVRQEFDTTSDDHLKQFANNANQHQHHHLQQQPSHSLQQPLRTYQNSSTPLVVNSALGSPSSGYCSSEDCHPAATEGGPHCVDDIQSSVTDPHSFPSSSLLDRALNPYDPCLGQQLIDRCPVIHYSNTEAAHYPRTMYHDFIDDCGSAWSGAIGFEELEAYRDPFGGYGADRLASADGLQRVADWTVVDTAEAHGVGGVERMDLSTSALMTSKNQSQGGAFCSGHAFAQFSPICGDFSFMGISPSRTTLPNGEELSSCETIYDASIDSGVGLSTGELGESSLVDILQGDAYLSSTSSAAAGCNNGFALGAKIASSATDFDIGYPLIVEQNSAELSSAATNQHNAELFHQRPANPSTQYNRVRSSPALHRHIDNTFGGALAAGYHLQHMAADMATGCDGEMDDFELFSTHNSVHRQDSSGVHRVLSRRQHDDKGANSGLAQLASTIVNEEEMEKTCRTGTSIFSGVFGHRNPGATTLRTCPDSGKVTVVIPASRSRGLVTGRSCGSLLQLQIASQRGPGARGTKTEASARDGSSSIHSSEPSRNRTSSSATRGGRSSVSNDANYNVGTNSSSLYPGLDDHRYSSKPIPNGQNHPPSKIQRTHRSGTRPSAGAGRASTTPLTSVRGAADSSPLGSRSILEAFLRSTRPMDPNKGSNAVLAAQGLHDLHIGGDRSPRKHRSLGLSSSSDHDADDDDQQSGTLLKKLLTGELDQLDVERRRDRDRAAAASRRHVIVGKRNHSETEISKNKWLSSVPMTESLRTENNDLSAVHVNDASHEQSGDFHPTPADDCDVTFTAEGDVRDVDRSGSELAGLDIDLSLLDDPNCMALFGMIDDVEIDDGIWMSAATAAESSADCCDIDNKISSFELNEILNEGLQQTSR